LDANEFLLSKSLRHYITRNLFSSPLLSKRLTKSLLFEAISFHSPMGPDSNYKSSRANLFNIFNNYYNERRLSDMKHPFELYYVDKSLAGIMMIVEIQVLKK
jgi:hypothetical protein